MTLLKERGRSDDNDARAFLLRNAAEERFEPLRRVANREKLKTALGQPVRVAVAAWGLASARYAVPE